MNWFRHNRWLGTFLIVFGIATLLSLLLLWRTHGNFVEANAGLTESMNEKSRLERLNPFPNESNYEKMKVLLANYRATLVQMKAELRTRMVPVVSLAPNEFQARLRQMTGLVAEKRARKQGAIAGQFSSWLR